MCPNIDYLIIAFVVGDETHVEVVHHFFHLSIAFSHECCLFFRDDDVAKVERQAALERHVISHILYIIEELSASWHTAVLDNSADDAAQRLLRYNLIDITYFLRHELVEQYSTHRGVFLQHLHLLAVFIDVVYYHRNYRLKCHLTLVVSDFGFFGAVELQAFALLTRAELGDVVKTEHHVLRRHGDRLTIGRVENVVRTEHQQLCFEHCLVAEWQVHSHLVTIEVGVECRTCQWVKLDSLTFNHARLECLDTETVKCRGTVQEHGVTLHYIFEDVPYHRFFAVDYLLGALHCLHYAALYELADDERLVELCCHKFRYTALVHLQFRTYHDYRTCRVVNTLTEKVLTETTLLTLQAVGKRLELVITLALCCAALA